MDVTAYGLVSFPFLTIVLPLAGFALQPRCSYTYGLGTPGATLSTQSFLTTFFRDANTVLDTLALRFN